MREKRKHPELLHTRRRWMQHYLKVQDMLRNDHLHQSNQGSNQGGITPTQDQQKGQTGSTS
eukprot:3503694-Prorocentrum_lima.AAC.1